jgi:hypothetical protein
MASSGDDPAVRAAVANREEQGTLTGKAAVGAGEWR